MAVCDVYELVCDVYELFATFMSCLRRLWLVCNVYCCLRRCMAVCDVYGLFATCMACLRRL